MKKTIIAVLAAGALVLTACGSDSGSDGSDSDTTTADSTADAPSDTVDDSDDNGGGSAQDQLTAMLIESIEAAGLEYDADCISDKAHQLSDEDAEAIVAAGPTGDPDVSDEADAIGDTLLDCVTVPATTTGD